LINSEYEMFLRAVINLETSPDFQIVIKWVRQGYNDQLHTNTMLQDEVRLRWGQGMAQALETFLNSIDNARKEYNAVKR